MTIGIGFKCKDGLVLATDTKYTQGDLKSHGPKLFSMFAPYQMPNLSAVVAGAGTVSFMRRAAEEIEADLSQLSDPTLPEVRRSIETALLRYYQTHVIPRPAHWVPVDIELILGVWTRKDGYALLMTQETNVTLVSASSTSACTIGMGKYVANYALGLIFDTGATVETAKVMAAFCIKAAKDQIDSCGGSTHIMTMRDDLSGCIAQRVDPTDISHAESNSSELYEMAGELLRYLDAQGLADDQEVTTIAEYIGKRVVELRAAQRFREAKFRKARERFLASKQIKSAPPDPQPTTGDS